MSQNEDLTVKENNTEKAVSENSSRDITGNSSDDLLITEDSCSRDEASNFLNLMANEDKQSSGNVSKNDPYESFSVIEKANGSVNISSGASSGKNDVLEAEQEKTESSFTLPKSLKGLSYLCIREGVKGKPAINMDVKNIIFFKKDRPHFPATPIMYGFKEGKGPASAEERMCDMKNYLPFIYREEQFIPAFHILRATEGDEVDFCSPQEEELIDYGSGIENEITEGDELPYGESEGAPSEIGTQDAEDGKESTVEAAHEIQISLSDDESMLLSESEFGESGDEVESVDSADSIISIGDVYNIDKLEKVPGYSFFPTKPSHLSRKVFASFFVDEDILKETWARSEEKDIGDAFSKSFLGTQLREMPSSKARKSRRPKKEDAAEKIQYVDDARLTMDSSIVTVKTMVENVADSNTDSKAESDQPIKTNFSNSNIEEMKDIEYNQSNEKCQEVDLMKRPDDFLGCWILNSLPVQVLDLIYWRCPKTSTAVLISGLTTLLMLLCFSAISVVAYLCLFILITTALIRGYYIIMIAMQKRSASDDPFSHYLAFVAIFTFPKIYDSNKTQLDDLWVKSNERIKALKSR